MSRIPMCVLLAALLGLTTNAREADAGARRSRPLRTGQTGCWNAAGGTIACAGTGQDGELRRGEPRAYQDGGDGTIRDKRTALTWEKLCDDGSIHDKDNAYTWEQAFGKVEDLNTVPCLAGVCDWRLPNRFELETILDLEGSNPMVSSAFDTDCAPGCTILTCSCTYPNYHWTSSSQPGAPQFAWIVHFGGGGADLDQKTEPLRVRAVRGGS
jgi:hypothetical protein